MGGAGQDPPARRAGKASAKAKAADRDAPGAKLDFGYQMPDCIWDLPLHKRSRRNTTDFAEHGERRFVRSLLPIPIATGEEFRYGVWIEVAGKAFDKIMRAWDDPPRYSRLTFAGTIANAAPPYGARILAVPVTAGTREPGMRPFITASPEAWLQALITTGWSVADYRAAVASFT